MALKCLYGGQTLQKANYSYNLRRRGTLNAKYLFLTVHHCPSFKVQCFLFERHTLEHYKLITVCPIFISLLAFIDTFCEHHPKISAVTPLGRTSAIYLERCARKRIRSAPCFTMLLVYCTRKFANAFVQNKLEDFYTGLFSTMIIALEYVHFNCT